MNIKLSNEFKIQTSKAIFSIVLFLITYIVILILAVGLTIGCIYVAIKLVSVQLSVISIGLGIGLASLGVLVLIFLLKFMFSAHKLDRSHLIEITRNQEPKLFKMIDELAQEVETSAPKKVYLSMDVNAGVFYDSSFWSMFFPIQKNLHIGLGLVNSVTKDELRAILAHEFGHFSQRTMKVGSYVYNVNQIIYNMLYENDNYQEGVNEWASASGYFYIFVLIAMKINAAIQWILKQLYDIVNKAYMSLSREMEFHADEIAANITGYPPLKDSLLRLNLTDQAYSVAINFYNAKISLNQKPENVYRDQSFVMQYLAKEDNLMLKNNFPQVTQEDLNKFNKSKLVIKDQWASHPSTDERIKRLEATNIIRNEVDEAPANELFSDIEKTQKILTEHIFKNVKYSEDVTLLSHEVFKKEYADDFVSNSFPKIYNGYYDNKNPILFEFSEAVNVVDSIDELYSDQKVDLVHQQVGLQNDINTINQLDAPEVKIKTFDYDGKKYSKSECKRLADKLNKELEILTEQVKQNDMAIFNFFKIKEKEKNTSPKLENLYRNFFDYYDEFEKNYNSYAEMMASLQFIPYTNPVETIRLNFMNLMPVENQFKKQIKNLIEDDRFQNLVKADMKDNFEMYLSREWTYFGNLSYFDKNLEMLYKALEDYASILSKYFFDLKQNILQYQQGLIG